MYNEAHKEWTLVKHMIYDNPQNLGTDIPKRVIIPTKPWVFADDITKILNSLQVPSELQFLDRIESLLPNEWLDNNLEIDYYKKKKDPYSRWIKVKTLLTILWNNQKYAPFRQEIGFWHQIKLNKDPFKIISEHPKKVATIETNTSSNTIFDLAWIAAMIQLGNHFFIGGSETLTQTKLQTVLQQYRARYGFSFTIVGQYVSGDQQHVDPQKFSNHVLPPHNSRIFDTKHFQNYITYDKDGDTVADAIEQFSRLDPKDKVLNNIIDDKRFFPGLCIWDHATHYQFNNERGYFTWLHMIPNALLTLLSQKQEDFNLTTIFKRKKLLSRGNTKVHNQYSNDHSTWLNNIAGWIWYPRSKILRYINPSALHKVPLWW